MARIHNGAAARPRWPVVLTVIASFVVVTLVIAVASAARLSGPSRPDLPGETVPRSPDTGQPGGEPHLHGDHTAPSRRLTTAERALVDEQLAQARRALPGDTVADALAAGYEVSNTLEGPDNVHLLNRANDDGRFDPARPSQLLATSRAPSGRLLAVVYFIETPSPTPPEGFAGPQDHWHHHEGDACDLPGKPTPTSKAACVAAGGIWGPFTGWMLHTWLVPGVGNPDGLFVADNPCLRRPRSCPESSPVEEPGSPRR